MLVFESFGSILADFLPILMYGVAVLIPFSITGLLIYRRKDILEHINSSLLGRGKVDYKEVFRVYIEKLGNRVGRNNYDKILDFLVTTLNVEGATILLKGSDGKFRLKATHSNKLAIFVADQGDAFFEHLSKQRKPVTRLSLSSDKLSSRIKSEGLRFFVQLGAEATIPLFVGTDMFGLINVGELKKGDYDKMMLELLEVIGVQLSVLLHNENLYELLFKQNRRIQELKAFRQQLLTNLSHELRTPLNGVIGITEMMVEGAYGQMTAEQMEHLAMIRQSGLDILKTIEMILDLTKLENNQLKLDVKKLNVARLLRSVTEYVSPKDCSNLSLKIDSASAGVYGDEDKLLSVFKNLLKGPMAFGKEDRVVIETQRRGEMLMVSIKRNEKETKSVRKKFKIDHLFDSSKLEEDLGLSFLLSRKVVELHGGRISLLGKGKGLKEVCVSLPMRPGWAKQ